MIKEKAEKFISGAIRKAQKAGRLPLFEMPDIRIERPPQGIEGDLATNVAMIVASLVKKSPEKIAEIIADQLKKVKELSGIRVKKPGFINFHLSPGLFYQEIERMIEKKEDYGNVSLGKGEKVQIEFISANPTGPLTVANARGGPFGDVLGNVFKKAGYKIEKAYYINDYGNQILTLGHSVLKDKEAKYKGKYIDELNKKIKEKDPYRAGERAAKIIADEIIKKTTKRMGIEYDEWFSENSLHQSGEVDKAIGLFRKKGLVYEKDNALWFKSSQYGDKRDRVLVKADGSKTYLAGDSAYHRYKFEKKKFYKVIDIWGADHHGDVPGLKAVVEALGHRGKLDIILLQFVTLLDQGKKIRMSKRKGIYVTMDELLDEVGRDVVRFFFLEKAANTHLNFDVSLAREQSEKNPVYYVQYAHARICSILKKANKRDIKSSKLALLTDQKELELIKQLIRFPEIIEDTAKDYQVQRIPQYARELAESFHRFYTKCKVITGNKQLKEARLTLVSATRIVLKNTLDLMGISAPEKM